MYDYFQQNKVELFNCWLDNEQSWDKCKIMVDRIHEQQNESKRGWISMQGRDIKARYPAQKATQIIESRKSEGLYYEDPDFPGDDDDTKFIHLVRFTMYRCMCFFVLLQVLQQMFFKL